MTSHKTLAVHDAAVHNGDTYKTSKSTAIDYIAILNYQTTACTGIVTGDNSVVDAIINGTIIAIDGTRERDIAAQKHRKHQRQLLDGVRRRHDLAGTRW